MKIRKSRKTNKLIIDGQGATILLEAGQSLDLKDLKNFKLFNFKIRRKQSPMLNITDCKNGEISFCDIRDSEE